jgi:hypothetical protein
MFRQTPSGPTFTQAPHCDVLLGAGFGADGAVAPWGGVVAAGGGVLLAAWGADVGVGSAPPLRGVPPPLLLVPLPWPPLPPVPAPGPAPLPGPVSAPWPPPAAAGLGGLASDAPEMGIASAVATGNAPEADDGVAVRGAGRTRIETVEKSRNAIAPPESTMTGTVLPAGCRRKTAPARPMAVLIQSASSANASRAAGSRGQWPIRADSRSLRSADRRCGVVRPDNR